MGCWLLLIGCSPLVVDCSLLFVVHCSLLLHVMCWLLVVVCCLLRCLCLKSVSWYVVYFGVCCLFVGVC